MAYGLLMEYPAITVGITVTETDDDGKSDPELTLNLADSIGNTNITADVTVEPGDRSISVGVSHKF